MLRRLCVPRTLTPRCVRHCVLTDKPHIGVDIEEDHVENRNIVFLGPPGTGKTTVGKVLAKKLDKEHYDIDDHHYEQVLWKRLVSDVLTELGSDKFMLAEAQGMWKIDKDDAVISLTGSNPLNERAMRVLKGMGCCLVYLDPHLGKEIDERGAVNDRIVGIKPGMTLLDVLKWRTQFYEKAYHIRIPLGFEQRTPEEIAEETLAKINQSPWYKSTRGDGGRGDDLLYTIRQGLANDGGLFLPHHLPTIQQHVLERWATLDKYSEVARRVLESFCAFSPYLHGITPQEFSQMATHAYSKKRWSSPDVVPVTNLEGKQWLLDLTCGPTAAFKDLALQIFPKLFSRSILTETKQYTILTATSGDTGSATMAGFMGQQHIQVIILYPSKGVSPLQEAQMRYLDENNSNLHAIPVDGDFDFCQSTVKKIFNDTAFGEQLQTEHNAVLSSANSINWGRLVPQIVYYFWGYFRLFQQGAIDKIGDPINVCVPTGNFGNILAAYLAKKMGLPINKMVSASNVNNVLTDFIQTGVYDISQRNLTTTSSPSIDILRSSNVERLLYYLSGEDPAYVSACMNDLQTKHKFEITGAMKAALQEEFYSSWCTEEDCHKTIKEVLQATGKLLDPHTAVAKFVADKFTKEEDSATPLLIAATAHWGKFPEPVYQAVTGNKVGDFDAAIATLEEKSGEKLPQTLRASLGSRQNKVEVVEASVDTIKKVVEGLISDH
eukprot:TRINITY_DN12066_c0_g1_i1.p1 TRINITY_DN12066_c0_g1~~TRINITY_DN12066_c0_g1_i1.p1  ORF type:complete len:719 (+),score=88.17 TRINITY_DN12066_c0_g1_i1:27-2183(+)